MKLTDVDFFLSTSKQMLIIDDDELTSYLNKHPELNRYPSIIAEKWGATCFFKSTETAERVNIEKLSFTERGLLLGYPMSAVQFFVYMNTKTLADYNSLNRVIVKFVGLSFVCSKDLIPQVERELFIMYGSARTPIEYIAFII